MKASRWPELEYETWKPTYQTVHMWSQIVGKIRACKEPWANHSWYSTLYVTPRGLSTSAIPDGDRNFSVGLDFLKHRLHIQTSDDRSMQFSLQGEPIAIFFERVMTALKELGIETNFDLHPNEVMDNTSFTKDTRPRVYKPEQAQNCWQVLVPINNVLKEFRSRFIGKCSPVHFFWGGFDIAVTRFSGKRAPEHPGGIPHLSDRITREAYSHEVSSCGFWPGNEMYPHAAFYSYAYPEPPGFSTAKIQPAGALYHSTMREFFLPYDEVRNSQDPAGTLLNFLQSTYEAAANLGGWDRKLLEESSYLTLCQKNKPSPSL
jgi:hypothetical protein